MHVDKSRLVATHQRLLVTNSNSCHRELRHGSILPVGRGSRWAEQPIRRQRLQWHHPQAPASGRSHFSSQNPLMCCPWHQGPVGTKLDFGCSSCRSVSVTVISLILLLYPPERLCLCQFIFCIKGYVKGMLVSIQAEIIYISVRWNKVSRENHSVSLFFTDCPVHKDRCNSKN